jgi:hypothetical protein
MEIELLNAYRNTDYIVHGFREPIRVGEVSAEADEFLLKKGYTDWAFLTAFNPMSVEMGHSENEQRNHNLAECIAGYDVLKGEGKDRAGIWPPKASFFIAGITFQKAVELAQKFGQRAMEYGKIHQLAELVEIFDYKGNPRLILEN